MMDRPSPLRGISFAALQRKELPEQRWIVPGLLPEGLAILAGRPKSGKSWAALNLVISTASGGVALGRYQCPIAGALYLALEDNERRFKRRMEQVLDGAPAPDNAKVFLQWPRLNEGGLDKLRDYLKACPDVRLVVVDTFARVRPPHKSNGSVYADDYADLVGLKALADEFGIAVLVVHHTRKADAEDVFDTVSGSTGLTGAADTIWVLKRGRGRCDAILHVTGRDVDESESALNFDVTRGLWTILGGAAEYQMNTVRAEIIRILRESDVPLGPKPIAERTGMNYGNVKMMCSRMVESGELVRVDRGLYRLAVTLDAALPWVADEPREVTG